MPGKFNATQSKNKKCAHRGVPKNKMKPINSLNFDRHPSVTLISNIREIVIERLSLSSKTLQLGKIKQFWQICMHIMHNAVGSALHSFLLLFIRQMFISLIFLSRKIRKLHFKQFDARIFAIGEVKGLNP